MTQKDYQTRLSIMELCRVFADQMHKCMDNAGLNKDGFKLTIEVGDEEYGADGKLFSAITLEEDINDVGKEQWRKTQMCQMNLEGKGWLIHADPLAESGDIPPAVYGKEECRENSVENPGEVGTKAYPPDNLWISSRDDHPVLGGGQ